MEIDKLLKKRKPKGEDIGRLYLADMALARKKGGSPVTDQKFQSLLSSITDPEEIDIYNKYLFTGRWIELAEQAARTDLQQANFRYFKLGSNISNALTWEELYGHVDEPAVWENPEDNPLSLNRFFPGAEYADFYVWDMSEARRILIESICRIESYNRILEMMSEAYKVDEILAYKVDVELLKSHIDWMNDSIEELKEKITESDRDAQLKEKLLAVVRDNFQPINLSQILEAPKERMDEAKRKIQSLSPGSIPELYVPNIRPKPFPGVHRDGSYYRG